jgi:membrane protease YdiL (CAAX protease family)
MFVKALATGISVGLIEEVLFRGLLYNVLCRYLDRWTAACAGALVFSFVHGVIADQWALFALGLVLTGVYERTGRLLPAVVLHATNNAVAIGSMMSM